MDAVLERSAHAPAGMIEPQEVEVWSKELPHAGSDTSGASRRKTSRGRLIAFYIVAGVTGSALIALGVLSATWPWYAPAQPFFGMHVEAHRWHGAEFTALLAILLGGSLLALLWRPGRRTILAQYLIVSGALITILFEIFAGPMALLLGIPFVLIAMLYPNRAALLDIRMPERWSRPLTWLSAAAATLLIQPTYLALDYQVLYPLSEHATHFHWVAAAALALALTLGGLLAATQQAGWRILATLVAIAYTYLGMAAIATPTHAGSWGVAGGALAAVAGALYLALAILPARQLAWYADGVSE